MGGRKKGAAKETDEEEGIQEMIWASEHKIVQQVLKWIFLKFCYSVYCNVSGMVRMLQNFTWLLCPKKGLNSGFECCRNVFGTL